MILPFNFAEWSEPVGGLLLLLLTIQQWRMSKMRRFAIKREELFRVIAENAADMIALVDVKGHRLYNSPAYEKILGYSPEELKRTSIFEQIHPEDRFKILEASREASRTGIGKKLEYRIQHKNGDWRILESTASTIKDHQGNVEKLVIVNRDITERKLAEEALERNSFHDELTDLPNRRLFLDRLQRAFSRAQRNPAYSFAVLFVDVDNFKAFNESMGEAKGNLVIKELGNRLTICLRADDTVARPKGKMVATDLLSRMGGDEFTILLENIGDSSDAMRAVGRIQKMLAEPIFVQGQELHASVSIGVALSRTEHNRAEDYLEDAEAAMRRAKACGGSRCEVFDESLHRHAVSRLTLEAELQKALQHAQFELHYQPIVKLDTREDVGFEALLRWRHPERGVISPSSFLEIAENKGLIVAIGSWALGETCRQLRLWQDPRVSLTVKVSSRQIAHPNFLENLRSTVHEFAIQPGQLQIEISELAAMTDPNLTQAVCTAVKRLGVGIVIGDFGKGLSSLICLRRLPLDELKLDRSLTSGMTVEIAKCDVVRLMITVAANLKLRLVAAGVESESHLKLLTDLGCEFGQGMLFSQPLPPKEAWERHSHSRAAHRQVVSH